MKLFDILAILVTFSALFSYLNHRFLRFPRSVGLMLIAIVLSLLVTMLGWLGLGIDDATRSLVASIDFNRALMGGMLSFLLFAGALHVNLGELAANKWTIGLLASVGLLASALLDSPCRRLPVAFPVLSALRSSYFPNRSGCGFFDLEVFGYFPKPAGKDLG